MISTHHGLLRRFADDQQHDEIKRRGLGKRPATSNTKYEEQKNIDNEPAYYRVHFKILLWKHKRPEPNLRTTLNTENVIVTTHAGRLSAKGNDNGLWSVQNGKKMRNGGTRINDLVWLRLDALDRFVL